jgi:hypothetical protein
MRLKALLAILLFLSATGVHAATATKSDPTVRLCKIYTTTIAKYDMAYTGDVSVLAIEYIKNLRTLRASEQRSGDLDGWTAAKNELNRFQTQPTLTAESCAESTGELRSVQAQYFKLRSDLISKKHHQVLELKKRYTSRLAQIQTELTRAGDFEAAYKAKSEIERVNAAPEVTEAEAFVAKQSQKPDPQASATSTNAPPHAVGVEKKVEVLTEVKTLSDGSLIYPPGISPPYDSTMIFKRTTLSRTSGSPLTGGVSANCWNVSQKKSSTSSSSSYYSSYRSRFKTDSRSVRLMFSTTAAGQSEKDLNVNVKFFSRPTSKTAGRVKPVCFAQKYFAVPVVDSRTVYVDLAPVTVSSRSSSSSYTYSSRSGSQFYGCIVTASTSDGKILLQGATISQLKPYAPSAAALTAAARKAAVARDIANARAESERLRQEYYLDINNRAKRAAYMAASARYQAARAKAVN